MKRLLITVASIAALTLIGDAALADATAKECAKAANLFRDAGESGTFFGKSYGYAVYPTIGKAGFVVGGAYGTGCVFVHNKQVGTSKMTQASFGWLAGAQGYTLIVFFEDERAYKEFSSGTFEFGAGVNAVAITAAASASTSTGGSTATASGGKKDAATAGGFQKGLAPFSIVKGGLMYEAALNGAKFSFKKL
ncbi:MAG: lipid-binding SYLF domain-containing protein [Steroidobacteraceae bacterium]